MSDETVNGKLVVTDKIGIGIEEPIAQLHIASSTTAPSQTFLESGGALLKLSVDATGAAIGTDNAFPLSIKTDDTSRISIDKVGNISLSGALSVQNSLTVSGNVGIGTTIPPTAKLEVAGIVKATSFQGDGSTLDGVVKKAGDTITGALTINNTLTVSGNVKVNGQTVIDSDASWHRSYGNAGWYNGTYGGGWYMEDSTWIRSYGGKNIYHDTGILRTDGTLQVGPNGNRFVVDTSGNVGIGTTSPAARLEISDSSRGSLKLLTTSGLGHDFGYDGGGDSLFWFTHYGAETGETKFRWENGTTARDLLVIKNNGQLIGRQIQPSSRKLKKNIIDLASEEAFKTLKDLNPVKFNYCGDSQEELNVGFIAEDVPDLVATSDRKGVSSIDIVAVLTKVVKEQQNTISVLVEKIKALEEKQNQKNY